MLKIPIKQNLIWVFGLCTRKKVIKQCVCTNTRRRDQIIT